MSTELCTIKNTGSRGVDMSITRYYGGVKAGPCVQLTAIMEEGRYGYIQLSTADLIALIPIVKKHVMDYAFEAKIKEAEDAIAEYKELEKTVVSDMRDIGKMAINAPVWDMANLLFYGKKEVLKSEEFDGDL